MEPEQRKLPRLLCFYTDTTNNSTTKPAPPSKGNQESSHQSPQPVPQNKVQPPPRPPTKCQPPQFPHHETTNRRKPHQPHVKAYQNQMTSVVEARRQRKPVRSISHGVIRVPLARILWGCFEAHDRRCRSSVVGYLETCTSGTLPPCLCVDWALCRLAVAGYNVVWLGCCYADAGYVVVWCVV